MITATANHLNPHYESKWFAIRINFGHDNTPVWRWVIACAVIKVDVSVTAYVAAPRNSLHPYRDALVVVGHDHRFVADLNAGRWPQLSKTVEATARTTQAFVSCFRDSATRRWREVGGFGHRFRSGPVVGGRPARTVRRACRRYPGGRPSDCRCGEAIFGQVGAFGARRVLQCRRRWPAGRTGHRRCA